MLGENYVALKIIIVYYLETIDANIVPYIKHFRVKLFVICRYCGPGTDIELLDSLGGPLNDADEACRRHEIGYSMSTDETEFWKVDHKLLDVVKHADGLVFPLFYSFFKANKLFEQQFGSPYTASAEVRITTTGNSTDKMKLESYEEMETVPPGQHSQLFYKKHHDHWKQMVHDAWRGTCKNYVARSNGGDDESHRQKPSKAGTSKGDQQPSAPPPTGATPSLEEENIQCESTKLYMAPKTPSKF